MNLTRHFCENWSKRVGGEPTTMMVQEIIRHSVELQSCRVFVLENGRIYKRLALYWNPDMDVVIFMDHIRDNAVSLLTRKNYEDKLAKIRETA